jgi:hypothetical protein
VQTVSADEVDEGESDEYQYYHVGDQTIRISTAHTEEKVNALNMLACYAEHLQELFAPYCPQVAKIVTHVLTVPLLNDEEMRGACATLVPLLLEDMQLAEKKGTWPEATPRAVSELYEELMKALLKVHAYRCASITTAVELMVLFLVVAVMLKMLICAHDGMLSLLNQAVCFYLWSRRS